MTDSKKIRTFSGMRVNPLRPESVSILDIAHGLAGIRRYGSQSPLRYTVAQHSVTAALMLREEWGVRHCHPTLDLLKLMLQGLLHDAHEAYFGDVTSPVKALLPGVKEAELECQAWVRRKLDMPEVFDPRVKEVDTKSYHIELERLWRPDADHMTEIWDSERAKQEFLDMYYDLVSRIDAKERKEAA